MNLLTLGDVIDPKFYIGNYCFSTLFSVREGDPYNLSLVWIDEQTTETCNKGFRYLTTDW